MGRKRWVPWHTHCHSKERLLRRDVRIPPPTPASSCSEILTSLRGAEAPQNDGWGRGMGLAPFYSPFFPLDGGRLRWGCWGWGWVPRHTHCHSEERLLRRDVRIPPPTPASSCIEILTSLRGAEAPQNDARGMGLAPFFLPFLPLDGGRLRWGCWGWGWVPRHTHCHSEERLLRRDVRIPPPTPASSCSEILTSLRGAEAPQNDGRGMGLAPFFLPFLPLDGGRLRWGCWGWGWVPWHTYCHSEERLLRRDVRISPPTPASSCIEILTSLRSSE